jgi:dextranase
VGRAVRRIGDRDHPERRGLRARATLVPGGPVDRRPPLTADAPRPFADLPAFCPTGAPLRPGPLPAGTARLLARSALRAGAVALPLTGFTGLDPATWAIEAWSAGGRLLGDELVVVADHPGASPVPGFATTFTGDAMAVTSWLRALRCTVVQAYDWMASYSRPFPAEPRWHDPLGRPVELAALRALAGGLAAGGAVLQAYAPVYAADPAFAAGHPGQRLYRSDGAPEHLGGLLEIMNPADERWQRHWTGVHRAALGAVGFGGLHLDTYGYPRAARDQAGRPVPMGRAYRSFLAAVATAFPAAVVSFNQVNGVPPGLRLSSARRLRYIEVWPPNHGWRHLEGLIARSAGASPGGGEPVVLAIYPPVWSSGRAAALRTVLLTEAIVTVLGAGLLVWGDHRGALRHPYYPDHERLSGGQARTAVRWHRFALRHRDLFDRAFDTSWSEIGDENGSVTVTGPVPPSPEPLGGTVFTRVVRRDDLVAVSLIDLTGSASGRWDEPTGPSSAGAATVDVLVDSPGGWVAEVAVPGRLGGRFRPARTRPAGHREGTAVRLTVPLRDGWAIVRLARGA